MILNVGHLMKRKMEWLSRVAEASKMRAMSIVSLSFLPRCGVDLLGGEHLRSSATMGGEAK